MDHTHHQNRDNPARTQAEVLLADPSEIDRLSDMVFFAATAMCGTDEQAAADWNDAVLLLATHIAPRIESWSAASAERMYEALSAAAVAAKGVHEQSRGRPGRMMMVGIAGAMVLSTVDWSTPDTASRTRLLDFIDQNLCNEPGDIPLVFSMASFNDNRVGTFGSGRLLTMALDDGGYYLDTMQSADSGFRVFDLLLSATASLITPLSDKDLSIIAERHPSLMNIERARALVDAKTLRTAAGVTGLDNSERLI